MNTPSGGSWVVPPASLALPVVRCYVEEPHLAGDPGAAASVRPEGTSVRGRSRKVQTPGKHRA